MQRRVFIAIVVGLATAISASPAAALIVENQTGTTVAPADDPGWEYFPSSGLNYVYLGNGWALSAAHVGVPGVGQSLALNGGSFDVISNQTYIVKNPAGSGTTNTDLRLIRLNGDPGLAPIKIASEQFFESTPIGQREVVIIGRGPSRQAAQTRWNVTPQAGPDTWTENAAGSYAGYKAVQPSDFEKRWGKNQIADEDCLLPGACTNDADLSRPSNIGNEVQFLFTVFDMSGLTNEAQVVAGDSGAGVFYKRNGQWELVGIVNAQFIYENQPGPGSSPAAIATAVYGNYTAFADLWTYNQAYSGSISDIMDAHPYDAVMGDINLDGVVSGTTTNGVPTGDIAAFVAGWGSNNPIGVGGTYGSWLKGDLNQDGKTDAGDFLLLRSALNPSGAGGLTLQSLLGGVGVPEPTSFFLALAGAGLMANFRSRRRN